MYNVDACFCLFVCFLEETGSLNYCSQSKFTLEIHKAQISGTTNTVLKVQEISPQIKITSFSRSFLRTASVSTLNIKRINGNT